MMSLTFGLFIRVSDLGPHDPLVLLYMARERDVTIALEF